MAPGPSPAARHRLQLVELAAAVAIIVTIVSLVEPRAARPMVTAVVVMAIVAIAIEGIRRSVMPTNHLSESSFSRRYALPPVAVPRDLVSVSDSFGDGAARQGLLPYAVGGRLRRIAVGRLHARHGWSQAADPEFRQLRTLISPALWRLISGSGDVHLNALDPLLTEVEQL